MMRKIHPCYINKKPVPKTLVRGYVLTPPTINGKLIKRMRLYRTDQILIAHELGILKDAYKADMDTMNSNLQAILSTFNNHKASIDNNQKWLINIYRNSIVRWGNLLGAAMVVYLVFGWLRFFGLI